MPHTVQTAPTPTLVIQPTQGWGQLALHEVWEYRDLLYFLLWREIKGRYRQMALGPLWIVLRPLFNMVLFTLIFGVVAKLPSDGVPYPVFTYTALLPWTFFSGAVMGASNSLLANRHLITKVYFPRLIIPVVSILSGLVDFCISFVILLGMMLYYWVCAWLGHRAASALYGGGDSDRINCRTLVCHLDCPLS